MFATNTDLQKYAPEVFDQGVDDWTDELSEAQSDVINHIHFKWWNKFHAQGSFHSDRLVEEQWTKATVYNALKNYILPKLTTFRPESDPFQIQISFYKERFEEEFDLQFGLGIKYDFNDDDTITDGDVVQFEQDRLYR